MSFQTGSIDKNGLARTEDGKLYVTSVGTAAITGTQSTGIPVLLAMSFVGVSGPADTSENILVSVAVPAGTLGSNGGLRIKVRFSSNNSAGSKTLRIRFGGIGGTIYGTLAPTTQVNGLIEAEIGNAGATNSQVGYYVSFFGPGSLASPNTAAITSAVDTTAATTLVITGQKSNGADTITLEHYCVEYIKASNT
jgi:hypothetical protein